MSTFWQPFKMAVKTFWFWILQSSPSTSLSLWVSNSLWFFHMWTIITMLLFITKGRISVNNLAYHNHWWEVRKRRRQSQLCRKLKSKKSIVTKYSPNALCLGVNFHTEKVQKALSMSVLQNSCPGYVRKIPT